jgi:hypothetical protein
MNMKERFENARFDSRLHLGLGDIRVSIGWQEEILEELELEKFLRRQAVNCWRSTKNLLEMSDLQIVELNEQNDALSAEVHQLRGDVEYLTEERNALRTLLLQASGPMSYGNWSTDFRDQVEIVLGRDYMGNETELHQKLYNLATQMIMIANDLVEYGRKDKAHELRGAAKMAHTWALEIRDEEDND